MNNHELQKFIIKQMKYLRQQEKLHWEYVNMSIGENPECTTPEGFDFANSFGLPYGYDRVIKYLERTFDVKEEL